MGRIRLPRGTNTQIGNSSGESGELIYNTSEDKPMIRDGDNWRLLAKEVDVPGLVGINHEDDYSGRQFSRNYHFYVRLVGSYSHTGGVVQFDSVTNGDGWDSDAKEFVAPGHGLYLIGGGLIRGPDDGYNHLDARIKRVGDDFEFASFYQRTPDRENTVMSGNCSGIVELFEGDRVRMELATSHRLYGVVTTGLPQSYMFGYLI